MKVVASISYVKLRQIGIGQGMNSEVFVAEDPQFNAEIVVKEIEKSKFLGLGLSNYFIEAQAMFKSHHENIVRGHYACETPNLICLAMPYYRRGSLTDRIARRSLALSELIRVGQGLLSGVSQVHLSDFVHFDIKPSNVLFDDLDVPMLADFGQARAVSSGVVAALPPIYQLVRPPELIPSGAVGIPQGDIFQVGLLLYRAVNGEPNYETQIPPAGPTFRADLEKRILTGKFPDRDRFLPHVPKHLRTVIRKALQVDPSKRYATAIDFADALSTVTIVLDWSVEWLATDRMRWTASRPGQPLLIVDLLDDGANWKIEIHTQSAGAKPRARATSDWAGGLTRADAFTRLRTLFGKLAA